ncbi:MAG: purine-nucleoside phosphorylase [Acidimicrobiia bacterium]|nr:purine-nucleoside phosphorylase [Acidimicrobiia bacterium]
MTEPHPLIRAEQAATTLTERLGAPPDVAVVLGSGWADSIVGLGEPVGEVAFDDLPGFPPPSVPGHGGKATLIDIDSMRVLLLQGRVHLYEGHAASVVVHPIRTAILAGCRTVMITNGCGAINPAYGVGQLVLIADHLNLTATSPLGGPSAPESYPIRFRDLTDAYSPRLRAIARGVDPTFAEGVYAGLPGPHFETPAEISMLRTMGADLVGMSTVLETIAARHLDAEVLGMSLVTNAAAGMTGEALSHDEVVEAGRDAGQAVGARLGALLEQLAAS